MSREVPGALPMQTRAAPIDGTAINRESRTVKVVFSTGAAVRRLRWEGWDTAIPFDEVLEVSENAVDLSRMQRGGPVLDSHDRWSTESQVAVVERAWIAGNEAHAEIRFPAAGISARADRIFGMVSDGITRNLSVGYAIDQVRVIEPEKRGDVEQRIVERWTPQEISFVTIPADAGAQVRSGGGDTATYPLTVTRAAAPNLEISMSGAAVAATGQTNDPAGTQETRVAPAPAPSPTPAPAAPAPAAEDTSARAAEIVILAERHAMPAGWAAEQIRSGATLDAVRTIVLDTVATRSEATQINNRTHVLRDEGDTLRAAVETALMHRVAPGSVQLDDAARQWRGMTLMEMGRTFIEETTGDRLRGLDRLRLASRILGMDTRAAGAMSTSDFPELLGNVVSRRLRGAYDAAPQNWRVFARQSNAADFRERAIVQLSNLPDFKRVREGGEYEYASLSEGVEKYALATYGRIVPITRQALINDDLGAFDRLSTLIGRAAAETEAKSVWAILTGNAVMGDNKTLFHADHGNLAASGSAISVASLNAGRAAMRKQKGFGEDAEPLNISPEYLIVGPDKETEAQQFLASIVATKAGDVNVFANSLKLVVEARLTGNAWYLSASPDLIDTIEYAYLEGAEGVHTEQRTGWEIDGIEVKGRLDFAAKAIDWRGFYKNPGA